MWAVAGLAGAALAALTGVLTGRPAVLALGIPPLALAAAGWNAERRADRGSRRLDGLVGTALQAYAVGDATAVHDILAATSSRVLDRPVDVVPNRPAPGTFGALLNGGPSQAWLAVRSVPPLGVGETRYLHAMAAIGSAALANVELVEQVGHAALHDPLTGLPNRALIEDRLEQAVALAGRSGGGLAVLLLDLDLFKVINDSAGHHVGDRVLVAIADRLRSSVTPTDTVGRFGGDEFVVMSTDVTSPWDAALLGEKLAAAVATPLDLGGEPIVVSISTGIAVMEPGSTAETLLRDADTALHQAKRRGRGRSEAFVNDLRHQAHARMEVEHALRRALDARQLHLAFQPVVALDTGRIVGAEALARWTHPEWGPVPTESFIRVAEESGLIVTLGEWVFVEACRRAREWAALGRDIWVSVNLSGRQLAVPGVVASMADTLGSTGVDPTMMVLEMTESVLMAEPDESAATLRTLRSLGPRLAVDDFGTGYSSLSYLKRFPVDLLKIDASFVRNIETDAHDRAIVAAVVALGQALALDVLVEGVEEPSQADLVRGLGCALGQGYRFAAPLDVKEMSAMLAASPVFI